MKFGDIATEIVCKLHEFKAARDWRRGRAERRKRALRKQGWDELYAHMAKHAIRTAPGAASQPASFTAQEAAAEADRDVANARRDAGSAEALGTLPLARPRT
jgi:hypothetical protein